MDKQSLMQRNNIIRAAVMGANDGILSVSGIVLGVAGATSHTDTILLAGFAGMLAGTVSMAMGEYVSVSSQHDAQERVRREQMAALANDYDSEFTFVKEKYETAGISTHLAQQATQEMMAQDPLVTTVRERYNFTLDHELSAKGAAFASLVSFPVGSILPMVAISMTPTSLREITTFLAVIVALTLTGYASAVLNGANKTRASVRNVIAGVFTMAITFAIGSLFR
ncbi:VIT family protein [Leuconostoc carnosum]|uniref:Integral membrane protein n=1 Tax=Leuconostoc carnosum (strain JB16) TaxID=1229758 RepID=K0D914_LEUCJ|nr:MULTISPECIES: VIT family protein [Leuconostoc]AFT81275.1 integral membrane protein [Leuconostoc carnosum JB16]KAA8326607.1 VIT family protein [Leuconostoc carnosum]KAA8330094.1 VIT family protein [Leuconostoc carnosum]KAA8362168.1 VIT family protein [Leuconostoc carnosum]KAA8366717.1 VIT family protein [Leuconostoc carnosum]